MKQVTKFNISYENKSQVNRTHGTGRASVCTLVCVIQVSFSMENGLSIIKDKEWANNGRAGAITVHKRQGKWFR